MNRYVILDGVEIRKATLEKIIQSQIAQHAAEMKLKAASSISKYAVLSDKSG